MTLVTNCPRSIFPTQLKPLRPQPVVITQTKLITRCTFPKVPEFHELTSRKPRERPQQYLPHLLSVPLASRISKYICSLSLKFQQYFPQLLRFMEMDVMVDVIHSVGLN
jgi:hypothetical protein